MERRDPSRVGELVRRRRIAAALSQEALAERAGLSARAVSDLERGVHQAPRLESLRLLAEALGLDAAGRAELLAAAHPQATAPQDEVGERSRAPASLPVPPTRLIGRETEVAAVARLLAHEDVRLLTLTGPGGTGKTRLALAVAERVAAQFPDGVVFVELAPLSEPALVASAIAERLGVREHAEQTMRDALVAHLTGKRLLLVLDNFEHVLPAAPLIAALLGACPPLRVVVTSRAPVRLSGEHLFPVAPLEVPDASPLPPLEDLGQIAAVRLFVARARAVQPAFALRETNAPSVVEIVRRLDGLPLALELVAARSRALSPAGIAARLERSLPLLTGGAQDLPARQRTLRDTIAWSYDLLRPDEQGLFRRLGVFAGGCTLEAAEAVGHLEESIDVLEGLAALLDASLVQSEDQDAEPRYTMLATIREFALEQLNESGEERNVRARHAHFFRDLAEDAGPSVWETAAPAQVDLLEREHDNLRAALAWSHDTGDHDTLLRLVGPLASFWYYRGYLNEGQRWLTRALETPADAGTPGARAWALLGSGLLVSVSGESERAAELLTESFRWWERARDDLGHAFAGSLLGGVYVSQGRYDEAAPLFASNRVFFRGAGHEIMLAHAVFHLGVIAWVQGDDARAGELLRESVEGYDRAGALTDAIDPLRYLGLLACDAGDLDDAARWFRAEWTRLRQRGSRAAFAVGLADVATLVAAREAWSLAARLFAKAEALLQAEAAAFSLPAREHYERAHARTQQALGDSVQAVAAAGRALTLEQALAEAEVVLTLDDNGDVGARPRR